MNIIRALIEFASPQKDEFSLYLYVTKFLKETGNDKALDKRNTALLYSIVRFQELSSLDMARVQENKLVDMSLIKTILSEVEGFPLGTRTNVSESVEAVMSGLNAN